jgi:UDP-glucuronate decarboxylase
MRFLVTGGAGFLGSHLCERLLREGHDVVALDNLYTGSEKNITSYKHNPKFKFINHNVVIPIDLDVDGIFNLACPASPIHYQKNPVETLKTNVLGAINILELAHKTNARVLQASTSEVYGDPEQSPQVESYWGNVNPIGIRSCYDEGKRAAETLFFDFHRQLNVDIRVARIFNTYGPRMSANDGRVVSNFIVQAMKNQDLTVYGTGTQTRSFCFVDDLIDGLIKLFFQNEIYGPVNLGNPEPITMLQLASDIKRLTNSESEIVFKPLPLDDPLIREPNINLAIDRLNWKPKVTRENGLIETIRYFKEEFGNF